MVRKIVVPADGTNEERVVNLNFSEISRNTGYSISHISRALRGIKGASVDVVCAVATYLCIPVAVVIDAIRAEKTKSKWGK